MLVISEIVRPFVNTLTDDEKYFPGNMKNLPATIQIKLPKKLNIFSEFFSAFLKLKFDFKYFERKNEFHGLCLSEIIDYKLHSYLNVKRVMFQ